MVRRSDRYGVTGISVRFVVFGSGGSWLVGGDLDPGPVLSCVTMVELNRDRWHF